MLAVNVTAHSLTCSVDANHHLCARLLLTVGGVVINGWLCPHH